MLAFCFGPIFGQENEKKPIAISLSAIQQHDDFKWSIAGDLNGENPNILSELSWKDLRSRGFKLETEIPLKKQFFFKGAFSQLYILNGTATDIDYADDGRQTPVFRADLNSNDGYFRNYQLQIGTYLRYKKIEISPYLGYVQQKQFLILSDDQLLKSSYKSFWKGIAAGIDLSTQLRKFNIKASTQYHQLCYNAYADWNLIDEFAHPLSFKHVAKGFMVSQDLGLSYKMSKHIRPFLNVAYGYWSTGAGIDELFYADGRTAKTRLNDVSRNSYHIGIGLKITI